MYKTIQICLVANIPNETAGEFIEKKKATRLKHKLLKENNPKNKIGFKAFKYKVTKD